MSEMGMSEEIKENILYENVKSEEDKKASILRNILKHVFSIRVWVMFTALSLILYVFLKDNAVAFLPHAFIASSFIAPKGQVFNAIEK